ncbi:hypothetical protein RMATCC62417_01642 [Rhizopus microsporus]|nr:hypothetical protein RMATCC62417_01642 [Rhizopus microsporus]
MDTFISEHIKQLDASLDTTFTKHVQEYSSVQQISDNLLKSTQALDLSSLPSLEHIRDNLATLTQLREKESTDTDLEWLFIAKCTLAVYGYVFSDVLNLTLPVSESIDYWNGIEGSTWQETYYALQTMPFRLYSLARDATRHISNSVDMQSLFTSSDYLLTQLFPIHSRKSLDARKFFGSLQRRPFLLQMIHEEIRLKRKALEKFRSEQAANLGMLLTASPRFNNSAEGKTFRQSVGSQVNQSVQMLSFLLNPDTTINQASMLTSLADTSKEAVIDSVVDALTRIIHQWPNARKRHVAAVQESYGKPSRLTRYWIPAVLSYFLGQITLRYALNRKEDIVRCVGELGNTVHDFLINWVWEPVRKVWETIRLKDQQLRLLSKQGLQSDLESLERMVIGFAKDNLHWTEGDLAKLAEDIREGDISVVLREYEKEIKSPLKNAVLGDLLQTILIQVQKTKVDVDLAMSALDKLLRSNELNFAFLAVAPSMLLTWASASWLKGLIEGRTKQRIAKAGLPIRETLRRIERQLIIRTPPQQLSEWHMSASQAWRQEMKTNDENMLQADCETQGLLLCEVHLLRAYASTLPSRNNTRARFLEDIRDLENPNLSNAQKIQTIARMSRFWKFI